MPNFLHGVRASNMLVLRGSRLLPLAPLQLEAVLKYQCKQPYDKTLLRVDGDGPTFLVSNGIRRFTVPIVYMATSASEER